MLKADPVTRGVQSAEPNREDRDSYPGPDARVIPEREQTYRDTDATSWQLPYVHH